MQLQLMLNLLVAVQILTALIMIGLVLIQHGKGADMGASFGSGASGSLFGATGSANFLSRSTSVCAAVFFVSTLALAYLSGADRSAEPAGSVLDRPAAVAPAASAAPTGAAQIPGAGASQDAAPIEPPAAPASGAAAIPSN